MGRIVKIGELCSSAGIVTIIVQTFASTPLLLSHSDYLTYVSLSSDSPAADDGDGNQGDDEDHCSCSRPRDQGQLLPQLRLEVVCME